MCLIYSTLHTFQNFAQEFRQSFQKGLLKFLLRSIEYHDPQQSLPSIENTILLFQSSEQLYESKRFSAFINSEIFTILSQPAFKLKL